MPHHRVLVVDDEFDMRELLATVFDLGNIPHEEASDGLEALERLRDAEYGAVLLDLMMPGANGFDVLRHLEQERPEQLRRVIVVSAGSEESLARVSRTVFETVRKPFGARALMERIRACIAQA
jgi:DNA-binding response OmpR family regulator